MVMHTHIIVVKELKPYPLTKIQLFLGEQVLKALMISEYIYVDTIQVVCLDLEYKHQCCKLESMSWIVFLMNHNFSRAISYHLTSLHQYTT